MNENYVTLGQVCTKGSSNIAQKDLAEREGQYPIYGAAGLIKNVDFAHQKQSYIAVVKDGAGIGRVMKLPAYSSVIGTMQYIFPKENVDIDYLFYALQHMNLGKYFSGSTIPHIYFRDYQKERLKLPVMEVQQRQADTLSRIDALSAYGQRQIALMDEIVKSRFVEMFGENVPTVRLGSVCQMINGDRGKNYPSGEDFVPMGVPFVNAGHLHEGRVDFSSMNYITEEKYALLSQGKMRKNDILYCLRGSLGKHGLVDFERGAVASSLVILRCNEQRILPQFLFYAIETPEIEKQLKAANNGSSQPNLSAASVKAYNIKLPSINKQTEFAAFVAEVDKSKFRIQKSLSTSRKLWTMAQIDAIMNMDFSTQRSL